MSTFLPVTFAAGYAQFRSTTFSAQSARVELVPASVPTQRVTVVYLDVVADDATTVSVVVGGLTLPFVFDADHLTHQVRTFAVPIAVPAGETAYAIQDGTAEVTIQVGSMVGR